jgi:hypothetical protein
MRPVGKHRASRLVATPVTLSHAGTERTTQIRTMIANIAP